MPFPTPGDFPNPGIKLAFLEYPALADGFFTSEPPGKFDGFCQMLYVLHSALRYDTK